MAEQEKYLSFVKHELRNQLVVMREGMSQVLDGLGNKQCERCFSIIKPSLECADKLNDLIGELLTVETMQVHVGVQGGFPSVSQEGSESLEKLRKKLAAIIAHEARTPLAIIKEGLALLLDGIPGPVNDKQREVLVDIQESGERMISSMEEILKKSWQDVVELNKIDLKGR